MLDSRDIGGLQGAPVLGRDNDKLGTVGQVFLDSETGAPNWVTVKTGLFGHKQTFVPLANARWDGEEVHVDVDRETLKEAPRIDTDEALSPHNEEALYRYYGLSDRDTDGGTARPDEDPDREYSLGPDGQTVTPIPTGSTDAAGSRTPDRDDSRDSGGLRDREALRDRDTVRDSDRDGLNDTDAPPRHADTAAVPASATGDSAADTSRADDAPRNLADFHPEESGQEPRDLRMSEQPLDATSEGTSKPSRLRRFDPAVDGQRVDPNDPPRNV